MRFQHSYPPPGYIRSGRLGRLLASNGTIKEPLISTRTAVASSADGDRHQFFVFCDGTETVVAIGTEKNSTRGIWDLYVNGVLDSSGYDDYAAAATDISRYITLTVRVVAGFNTFELRVNGKNALSSAYAVQTYGLLVQ